MLTKLNCHVNAYGQIHPNHAAYYYNKYHTHRQQSMVDLLVNIRNKACDNLIFCIYKFSWLKLSQLVFTVVWRLQSFIFIVSKTQLVLLNLQYSCNCSNYTLEYSAFHSLDNHSTASSNLITYNYRV